MLFMVFKYLSYFCKLAKPQQRSKDMGCSGALFTFMKLLMDFFVYCFSTNRDWVVILTSILPEALVGIIRYREWVWYSDWKVVFK